MHPTNTTANNNALVESTSANSAAKLENPLLWRAKFPPATSDVMLSHVQADFYIADAPGLEGNLTINSLEAMLYYLHSLPQELVTDALQKVIREFELLHAFMEKEKELRKHQPESSARMAVEQILQDVRALPIGQRYFFEGGYASGSVFALGHAIMHCIEKQQNGRYSLTTFNTGDGLNFHDYEVDKHGYRRYKPVVIYQEIEEANIFNLSHLLSLVDLRHAPLSDVDGMHGAEIIYDSILPAFGGVQVPASSELIQVMRAQRSSTCSKKVLNAILKQSLDPKTYKSVEIHNRMLNIKDYLSHKIKEGVPLTKSQQLHLDNDFEKLIRELGKDNHAFSPERKEKYYSEIAALKVEMQKVVPKAVDAGPTQIQPIQKADPHLFSMTSFPTPLLDLKGGSTQVLPKIDISLSTACPSKEKVLENIEKWVPLCEKLYQNGQYSDIVFSVNALIRNLPFPVEHVKNEPERDGYWGEHGERSDQEIRNIINQLTRLNELLFQSCFRLKKCHGDEILTTVTAFAIQNKLLESLLGYERMAKGRPLCGLLQDDFCHAADYVHICAAIETNVFAHDPVLTRRARECENFFRCANGFSTLIEILTTQSTNDIEMTIKKIKDHNKLKAVMAQIEQSARNHSIEMEIPPENAPFYDQLAHLFSNSSGPYKVIDYSLLKSLMFADVGQFKISPDFIASLNKQNFIASYFLGNKDFTSRAPGSEDPDAFTIQSFSRDEILKDGGEDRDRLGRSTVTSLWVKGVSQGKHSPTDSAYIVQQNSLKEIENPDIQRMTGSIIDNRKYSFGWNNPNCALTDYSRYPKLPPEEAQELITVANTPNNMILWQILSFFNKSIDKLQSRDYQRLFELVTIPSFEEEIKSNPEFSQKFFAFILSAMDEFQASGQIDAYLFLIRAGMSFEAIARMDQAHIDDIVPHWLDILRERLARAGSNEEKNAIMAQIAHTHALQSKGFNEDVVQQILKGLSCLQAGKLPASMKELKIIRPILEWLYQHDKDLQSLLKASSGNANRLCSAVFSESNPAVSTKWHENQYPIFESEDQQFRVNLLTGQTFVQNSAITSLPKEIIEDPSFNNLFQKKELKVRVEGFNRFYFTENQCELRVEKLKDGSAAIEQKRNHRWYRYLPISSLPSDFPKTMIEGYTHWVSMDANGQRELLVQDPEFKSCYWASDVNGSFKIQPQGSAQKTRIDSRTFLENKTYLARFETAPMIDGWADPSGVVNEIEFPRYGLHFSLQQPGVYVSKEFEGFHIAKNQELPHLPFASSYLIMENSSGKKQVLIPVETFSRQLSKDNPLQGEISSRREEPFSYLAIELNQAGEPKKLTQRQALYLAYLALVQKRYKEADKHLKIAESRFEDEFEKEVYKICILVEDSLSLSPEPDNHPQAKAIVLRAGLLLLKDMRYKTKTSYPESQKKVKALLDILHPVYSKYHAADVNAGFLKLVPSDERQLLQEFFNHGLLSRKEFDRFLYLQTGKDLPTVRRKADALTSEESRAMETVLLNSDTWNPFCGDLERWCNEIGGDAWSGKKGLTDQPLTRPKKLFIPYFLQVCLQIEEYRKDPEKKAELDYYLRWIKWTESGVFFRECLLDILNDTQNIYAENLKQLKTLSQGTISSYTGRGITDWMMGLAEKFHKRLEAKAKQKTDPTPLLKAPNQFPQWEIAPLAVHTPVPTNAPLWTLQQLEALFRMDPPKTEEKLPDLRAQGLKPHQKYHVDQFNKNKEKYYLEHPPQNSYTLKNPAQLETDLTTAILDAKLALKNQEKELLALANKPPKDLHKQLVVQREYEGGLREKLFLEDLFVLYLRGSEAEIFEHCPGLENDPKACKELLDKIGEYLIAATAQQQRKRVLDKLKELKTVQEKQPKQAADADIKKEEGNLHAELYALNKLKELKTVQEKQLKQAADADLKKEEENLHAELYALMAAKREEYSIASHPEFLVFEYKENILLRKKTQIDVLSLLTDPKGELDPSKTEVIVQVMPGEGKSKNLSPILAAKNADGKKLSMHIVPSSLYETNRKDLKQISKKTLLREPIGFEFDRNTPFTEEELRTKLWSLQNAIVHRNYVVTTAESLLCLKLKYGEILDQVGKGQLKSEEVESRMQLLSEIRDLIKTRSWALIDEPDLILDIRREVNFPLGKYHETPKERTTLIRKIYEILLDPKIEAWTQLKKNQPEAFSKKNFFKEAAPAIADHLIKDWIPGPIEKEELKHFLLGQLKEKELLGLDKHPQRGLISLAKEMITTFIPSALGKKGNVRFGLSHETNSKYPIPYKGNDAPDETSEFGNNYETLLYAANIYVQDGLKPTHIDELLDKTCRKIRLESKERGCRYHETAHFQKFAKIFGIKDPFALSSNDRDTLAGSVKNSQEALFYWLQHFVYPEVRTTLQKLNANGLTLVEMIFHVQGILGMAWNKVIYHDRLYKPYLEEELSSPQGEMRILHAIYQKVKDGKIHTLNEETPKAVLKKILEQFQFDALIDVGALMNGITNADVAKEIQAIAEKQGLSGVISFNDKNELVVQFDGVSDPVPLTPDLLGQFVSYYDQRHTTGTDIKHRATARAVLTFSANTIRDLCQGAMRMRKLLTSQNLDIVLLEAIKDQVAPQEKTVKFEQLMLYALVQQADRLAEDLFRFAKIQIRHLLCSEIDPLITSQKEIQTQAQLSLFFESLITDLYTDDLYHQFRTSFQMEDPEIEVNNYLKEHLDLISHLITEKTIVSFTPSLQASILSVKAKMVEKLNNYKLRQKELLAPEVPKENLGQLNRDSKVEMEKEMEMQVESEVKRTQLRAKDYSLWGKYPEATMDALFFQPDRTDSAENCPAIIDVNSLLPRDSDMNKLFDADLYTTKLFYQSVIGQQEPLFGQDSQKRTYQLVFVVEPNGQTKGIIVDPVEAGMIRKHMHRDQIKERKIVIADLETGFATMKGLALNEAEKEKLARFKVQAKFFNAEQNYTKGEWQLLKRWIESKDKKTAKNLFDKITSCRTISSQKSQNSPLQKYLAVEV